MANKKLKQIRVLHAAQNSIENEVNEFCKMIQKKEGADVLDVFRIGFDDGEYTMGVLFEVDVKDEE